MRQRRRDDPPIAFCVEDCEGCREPAKWDYCRSEQWQALWRERRLAEFDRIAAEAGRKWEPATVSTGRELAGVA